MRRSLTPLEVPIQKTRAARKRTPARMTFAELYAQLGGNPKRASIPSEELAAVMAKYCQGNRARARSWKKEQRAEDQAGPIVRARILMILSSFLMNVREMVTEENVVWSYKLFDEALQLFGRELRRQRQAALVLNAA